MMYKMSKCSKNLSKSTAHGTDVKWRIWEGGQFRVRILLQWYCLYQQSFGTQIKLSI